LNDNRFTATRHEAAQKGHATVFGIDDLELKLEGVAKGEIANCTGSTEAALRRTQSYWCDLNDGNGRW
jgi:hypothetical protein